jgi:hypothetical protein
VQRNANWAAAEVEATEEGFVLTVPLEGDADPDWDAAFRRVVDARRHEVWGGHWGHVRHRPDQVCVEQVTEGSEKALREFLETCIGQAEQELHQAEVDRREDDEALALRRIESSHGFDPTGSRKRADARRMTDRFREQ